ncbi:hypothetical protein DUNSADRAFT_3872 [Dunaliella salina]|uniref:Uncharacterized protein n=1 Tax=Dunaliella salina TaxID=3046 RepID=A0ABQ7GT81_DUNSA|nr:hypothetical protein DUNSADRAFT_3872 [Dunaliella salina]|eukprot:KAF5837800.1 hypothetical protein DUNSADRAFT_3872 [Dunaliella salina]
MLCSRQNFIGCVGNSKRNSSALCSNRRKPPIPSAFPRAVQEAAWPCLVASILILNPGALAGESLQDGAPNDSPYLLQDSIPFGVDETRGSLRPCPSNINPNCVSTASTNDTYGPAWRANEKEAKKAAEELEDAIAEMFEPQDYQLLSRASYPGGEYRAFAFTRSLEEKPDITEFYIKNEGVTNRNWEGDSEGALVTYRSVAGQVKYLWPISQPISDFGVQRGRLYTIRRALGWGIVGCEADVAECSQIEAPDLSLKGLIRSKLSMLGR